MIKEKRKIIESSLDWQIKNITYHSKQIIGSLLTRDFYGYVLLIYALLVIVLLMSCTNPAEPIYEKCLDVIRIDTVGSNQGVKDEIAECDGEETETIYEDFLK